MRKFTKVLALVIAIAILACPFVSAAGTAVNGGYANDAINLSVLSENAIRVSFQSEGFITSIIKLDVTGIALADDEAVVADYEVIGATAENLEPTVELALNAGVLTALIDGPVVTEYASVVFDIPVVAESSFTAEITNVKAGGGAGSQEYYIDLGFTDANGDIDAEAAAEAGLVLEVTEADVPVAHEHDFTGAWQYDETNHWHECECGETADLAAHTAAAAVQENVVPATTTTDGSYDSVVYCSVCGYEISRETVNVPATGAIQDDTLVIAGASVGYDTSSLKFTFRVKKTMFAKYDTVKLAITAQKYDTSTFNLTDPTVLSLGEDQLTSAGSFYTYVYTDIQLYELGLNYTYRLEGYDSEGNLVAYSATTTSSIAQKLKELAATSEDPALLATITDTLVVGDEAVEYFAIEGSDAANAPSILTGFDTSHATASLGTLNTVNDFVAYNDSFGTTSSATYRVYQPTVAIGKVPYISMRIRNAASLGERIAVSFTCGENAPVDGTFTVAGSYLNCTFDAISLIDSNADITFTVTLDGDTAFTYTYSIETYYDNAITNSSATAQISTALAKLGVSARALFA